MIDKQTNELLQAQTADYIDFVGELIEMGKIMSKRFYIVIGYNPAGDIRRGFFDRLTNVFRTIGRVKFSKTRFEKYKDRLFREADKVNSNLSSMGVKAAVLDTQSLIELFYNTYNPEVSRNENLVKKEELRIED